MDGAEEAFWDAVCAPDSEVSYVDRLSGIVDTQGREIVKALLAAGWRPPVGYRAAPEVPFGLQGAVFDEQAAADAVRPREDE